MKRNIESRTKNLERYQMHLNAQFKEKAGQPGQAMPNFERNAAKSAFAP